MKDIHICVQDVYSTELCDFTVCAVLVPFANDTSCLCYQHLYNTCFFFVCLFFCRKKEVSVNKFKEVSLWPNGDKQMETKNIRA